MVIIMKTYLFAAAVAAGLALMPMLGGIAEAKPLPPRPAAQGVLVPHRLRTEAEINAISARYNVPQAQVQQYYDAGWEFKELRRAAFLAYASGKDMGAVLDLKANNSWPRVEYKLGLTPNAIKAAHDKNDAAYLQAVLGIKEADSLPLLRQNFGLGDVAHAVLMGQYCTTTAAEIAAMHNPPAMDWDAVAAQLGISAEQMDAVRAELEKLRP